MNRNLIPMLHVCFSNPLHPYSRAERVVVFVVEIFWAIQVAAWLGIAEACTVECHDMFQCQGRRAKDFAGQCHLQGELVEEILTGYCCSPPVAAASECIRLLS